MNGSHLDVKIVPAGNLEHLDKYSAFETSAADAVANGRLYIMNGKGEFEQVALMMYWLGEEIRNVYREGYEINENGEITRDWRPVNNR